jgi:tRNA threonylcarbamoyladenosine biosynthesis protein TsaB
LKILALDTSTEACSVAVWVDGALNERFKLERHSEQILPMVQEVLAEAGLSLTQLDAIAFGRGPGSFTGLRIAAGVVQGLAFGANLPVVPVSSLAVLAQGVGVPKVLAATDARMHQVYWGAYVWNVEGLMELAGEEIVIAPQVVPLAEGEGWIGAGSGWDQYSSLLQARLGSRTKEWRKQCYPHAGDVARLGAAGFARGEMVSPEKALPIYIRDEIAIKQRPFAATHDKGQ